MANVSVRNLSRKFGDFIALDSVSFEVAKGEFLTLLGPSGCGKSTTLGALAGLDRPTSGNITIGNRTVFDSSTGVFVDAQFRNLGLMFQSYALWPHMTVRKNIDFALELRKIRGREAKERIDGVLSMVDMEGFADRYPGELSGGQQQRVALARTLAYQPEILLLDEPLSNLDAKLREKARLWLGDLQRRTGVTTIYVTHDQSEALALSDRIIVMNKGSIAQIGTPSEIYDQPADPFVADFVGASNLMKAELRRSSDGSTQPVLPDGSTLQLDSSVATHNKVGPVLLGIRPENVSLGVSKDTTNAIAYQIEAASYLGARNLAVVKAGGQQLRAECATLPAQTAGFVQLPVESLRVYAA